MSSPWWQPKNDAERAMSNAIAGGDSIGFLRAFVSAELYLPQVPRPATASRENTEQWGPLTRQAPAGVPAIPVFTSLAGMGSAVFIGKYAVTSFTEVRDEWAEPGWWVSINPGLPIDAHLPFDAVDKLISGELVSVDGRLMRPEEVARAGEPPAGPEPAPDPDLVLHDPDYPGSRDEYVAALLDATVLVPTTRTVVDHPDELLGPDFPWLRSGPAHAPTIEVFTSDDELTRAHPEQPSVRMPFLLLMIAWPDGHALSVNPGGRVRMVCPAEEMPLLRQQAIAG